MAKAERPRNVSEEIWKSGKQKSMKFYGHVAAAAGRFDRCVTTE
jgi:hypothetical protein